jgi:hypothetical protein
MSKKTAPGDQAAALYTSLVHYAIDANRAMASGMERAWQGQIEAFEGAVESMKPLAGVKQPTDLVSAQMALATDLNKQAMAATNNLLQIQRETGEELRDIANESMKAFSSVMPRAA